MTSVLLGYLDSNQEQKNQNLPCCQLHHTPIGLAEAGPTVYFTVRFGSRHIEAGSGVLRKGSSRFLSKAQGHFDKLNDLRPSSMTGGQAQ